MTGRDRSRSRRRMCRNRGTVGSTAEEPPPGPAGSPQETLVPARSPMEARAAVHPDAHGDPPVMSNLQRPIVKRRKPIPAGAGDVGGPYGEARRLPLGGPGNLEVHDRLAGRPHHVAQLGDHRGRPGPAAMTTMSATNRSPFSSSTPITREPRSMNRIMRAFCRSSRPDGAESSSSDAPELCHSPPTLRAG